MTHSGTNMNAAHAANCSSIQRHSFSKFPLSFLLLAGKSPYGTNYERNSPHLRHGFERQSVHHVFLYLGAFLLHELEAFVNICLKPDELKAQHSVSWLLCLILVTLRHSVTVAAAAPAAATPCLPASAPLAPLTNV